MQELSFSVFHKIIALDLFILLIYKYFQLLY